MKISPFNPAAGISRNATDNSSASSANSLSGGLAADSIEQQFLNYAKMSPLERMRASILKSMGLSEDDVKNMSPQEQQKVEEVIKEKIREQLDKAQNTKQDGTPGQTAAAPAAGASGRAVPSNIPSLSSSVLAQMISLQANPQSGVNAKGDAASAQKQPEF